MSINPSTLDELNKMNSVEEGKFLSELLELAQSFFDPTLSQADFSQLSFDKTEFMKSTFGLSNTIVSKYYSSLIFVLEELAETLSASEVKVQLSTRSRLKPEVIVKIVKIVDDNSAWG